MNNKKFNIIFGFIGVVLLIVLINVFYIYRRNENSKVMFNISSIVGYTWVNDDAKFKLEDGKMTFTVDDEDIVKNKSYSFNDRTGKFDIGNKEIYLRSVMNDAIIIWYEKAEYNLKKEVIAR